MLKRFFLLLSALLVALAALGMDDVQRRALNMLSRFTPYVVADYRPIDSLYGCFRGEHTMASDEPGVRTNADLSMICAFMVRYGAERVALPAGVSYAQLDTLARRSLAFAVATHKAVRRRPCADGLYWGSTSAADFRWESSLWALSVAYSAFFQWNRLSDSLRADVYRLLRAECNYELERTVPTGFRGDTKAEENGWEAGVLAATLGLFPRDSLAPQWFERMRLFAINSYSHPADSLNHRVIDAWYDSTTVAQLYRGANLYPDWTLQNHNLFHTSYQNVVIQELGEAALALRLFQRETLPAAAGVRPWHSRALLHNCDSVAQNVLNYLTLPDGEQAMPNGNDWSLYLYDQVTSYSTLACMLGDRDALLFEGRALAQIARRQLTTPDGSWLLRPDVGARRMGVEAHRVMMTWLMHEAFPTRGLEPSTWADFSRRHAGAKVFPYQRVVRTLTDRYFACFSFSDGLKSYTGYLSPIVADGRLEDENLVVPYRRYNTGNLLGWTEVSGRPVNARLAAPPRIETHGRYFSVQATLIENDSTLRRSFTLRSTPRGLDYRDRVTPLQPVSVTADRTGLLAVSTDVFTRPERSLAFRGGTTTIDGRLQVTTNSHRAAHWGDASTENSITTTKLCPYLAAPTWRHKISYRVVRKSEPKGARK